jgi:hypothetical protein
MEQWRRSLSQGVFSLSSRGPSGELEIHLRAVGSTTLDIGITTLIHSHLSWVNNNMLDSNSGAIKDQLGALEGHRTAAAVPGKLEVHSPC